MNNTTTTTSFETTTTSELPIATINSNWLNLILTNNLYIYILIGLSLNIIILIISIKKKREPDQTYRIIIFYQVIAAILTNVGRLLQQLVLIDLLSDEYLYNLQQNNLLMYGILNDSIQQFLNRSSQLSLLMLIPVFAINRFLAVIYPITFSIHMTTRRVHAYCIAVIAFVLIGKIMDECSVYFDMYGLFYTDGFPNVVLYIIATFIELLITPITSIWIMVKLLLHIRVLNNLHDSKGILEMIFISFALLIQSIYELFSSMPYCVIWLWIQIDALSLLRIYFNSPFLQWYVALGDDYIGGQSDTIVYALSILINVRVYAEVIAQIPMFFYRRMKSIAKKYANCKKTIVTVEPAPIERWPKVADNHQLVKVD